MIFLSYSREDKEMAQRVAGHLEMLDRDVWWDHELLTGTNYIIEINKRLQEAAQVIVLWSTHSIASEWVISEAENARARGILKPLRIADVNVPSPFNALHTVSIPPGADQATLAAACGELLEDNGDIGDSATAASTGHEPTAFTGKRILSLDGGGARVALQLGMLDHIETTLRETGTISDDGVLADHFHMIGGISAGSLVAALLAQGHTVAFVTEELGRFAAEKPIRKPNLISMLVGRSSANNRRVGKALENRFGAATFGSAGFKTIFVAVVWRVDRPGFEYFACNTDDPLWDGHNAQQLQRYPVSGAKLVEVLSAATSVPGYFQPVTYALGPNDKEAILLDGAATNTNPSLALVDYVFNPRHGLEWHADPQSLYLMSLGCGISDTALPRLMEEPPLLQAVKVLSTGLQFRVQETVQRCQSIFATRRPFYVHGYGSSGSSGNKRGRFQRLDTPLERAYLKAAHGLEIDAALQRRIADSLDFSADKFEILIRLGKSVASKNFGPEDIV